MLRKIFNVRVLMVFIFLNFIAGAVYTLIGIYTAPAVPPYDYSVMRTSGDYTLLFAQSIIGMLVLGLPILLNRKIRLDVPAVMMTMYAVFIYGALYLGAVRNFYDIVPHWDTVLHGFSGAALGALGFSLVTLLNKSESVKFTLSPLFVAMFAFCFAMTLGVFWEIYEYAADYFLGTNSQRYALPNGELLAGQAALADTMKDFIANTAGALGVSAAGYISLRYEKGWIERFRIKQS